MRAFVLFFFALALPSCSAADWQRGARFAIDLVDASCSFLEKDAEPEWLVYVCQAADVGGAILGGPDAPKPKGPPLRVRVRARDAVAFERAHR